MTTISTGTTLGITLTPPTYTNPIAINSGITISGTPNAVYAPSGTWTIENSGSVAGTGAFGVGVNLFSGGSVTNEASATITGYAGVAIGSSSTANAGLVVNSGSIAGTGTAEAGVGLFSGGSVTNEASASITGYTTAVIIGGSSSASGGTLVNDGSIGSTGPNGLGVALLSGGSVINAASGSISDVAVGVEIGGISSSSAGTVVNYGSIAASVIGVWVLSGGAVSNAASASIVGTSKGIALYAAGSVTNAASALIAGGDWGILFNASAGTTVASGNVTLLIPQHYT